MKVTELNIGNQDNPTQLSRRNFLRGLAGVGIMSFAAACGSDVVPNTPVKPELTPEQPNSLIESISSLEQYNIALFTAANFFTHVKYPNLDRAQTEKTAIAIAKKMSVPFTAIDEEVNQRHGSRNYSLVYGTRDEINDMPDAKAISDSVINGETAFVIEWIDPQNDNSPQFDERDILIIQSDNNSSRFDPAVIARSTTAENTQITTSDIFEGGIDINILPDSISAIHANYPDEITLTGKNDVMNPILSISWGKYNTDGLIEPIFTASVVSDLTVDSLTPDERMSAFMGEDTDYITLNLPGEKPLVHAFSNNPTEDLIRIMYDKVTKNPETQWQIYED